MLFPQHAQTLGQKIEFLSANLLPQGKLNEYLELYATLLHENIHYIDPVHELRGSQNVLTMLKKFAPRVVNPHYAFKLVSEDTSHIVWMWTISIRLRMLPLSFKMHGLVHALHRDHKIYYQREYFDPMESITTIPILGFFYKLALKLG